MTTIELDNYTVKVSSIDAVGDIFSECEYRVFYVYVRGQIFQFSDTDETLVDIKRKQILKVMKEF